MFFFAPLGRRYSVKKLLYSWWSIYLRDVIFVDEDTQVFILAGGEIGYGEGGFGGPNAQRSGFFWR